MGRVLITGASGYLGGRLCIGLVHAGYTVVALVRATSVVTELPPQVELVEGDVQDVRSLVEACRGCDSVIHAAALVGSWLPDSSKFFDVNVNGLKNVITAVKAHPSIRKLIYTSSFFALGPTDGYVADEGQIHSGKNFYSPYEESKALADKVALGAAAQGVPIVCLYPGLVYGPGKLTKGNSLAEMMIERFNGRMPGYLGNGYDRFSFCHVDDVVFGHLAAIEVGKEGEKYLLGGENASFHDVMDMAASLTHTPAPKFDIPIWVLRISGHVCLAWARLGAWTGISHQVPFITPHVTAVDILRHQWAYSSEKAERELGYKSRPLQEGLFELLTWMKDLGRIKY